MKGNGGVSRWVLLVRTVDDPGDDFLDGVAGLYEFGEGGPPGLKDGVAVRMPFVLGIGWTNHRRRLS